MRMPGTEGAGSSDASELRWLKAAFVVIIVIFAVAILLIQLGPLQQQANRGYYDSPASELGPVSRPFLPISTLDEAIGIANGKLPGIVGDAYVPFNHDDEYFWGELIWDHGMGNIYYWEMSQDDFSMAIDATTGDVVEFSWYRDQGTGALTREQVLGTAMRYVELFGGLPDDASPPSIEYVHRGATYHYNETTDEVSFTEEFRWYVKFVRTKGGIPTDDHLTIVLDPNGGYDSYYKVWNMRLGSVSVGAKVSYEEALEIARSVAEGANITSTEHRIVRPNYAWRDAPWRFGTDPVSVWRVTFEYSDITYLAEIDIDDMTGEIVGMDGYC